MRSGIREASWPLIGAFVLLYAVWSAAVNLGFRANVPFLGTLTANWVGLAVLVVGLLLLVGRLRPRDVGLVLSDRRNGLLFTIACFVLIQAGVALAASAAAVPGVVNDWVGYGARTTLSLLVAQLFGNALLEEIAFRGFLLPQIFLKLRRGGVAALVLAALGSQALFALAHVPNRVWVAGVAPTELPGYLLLLFVIGLWFASIYLLTRNLFAVVGLHALVNVPMLRPVGGGDAGLDMTMALVYLVVSLGLAALWAWSRHRWRRDTLQVSAAQPLCSHK